MNKSARVKQVTLSPEATVKVQARLSAKVMEHTSGCMLWNGAVDENGYGRFSFQGRNRKAHQIAYWLHTGKFLRKGLELDHTCNHRNCVNPAHLEPVTHAENIKRIYRRRSDSFYFDGNEASNTQHPLAA